MALSPRASLQRPTRDAQHARHAFDRSFMINFNQKCGALDPVFAQFVPAKSTVHINRSEFVRTADVNTAAFGSFTHCVDFFCVPLRQLWSFWENFYLNIDDYSSSLYSALKSYPTTDELMNGTARKPNQLPMFSNKFLIGVNPDYMQADYQQPAEPFAARYRDGSNVFSFAYGARRLLNRLGYGISYVGSDVEIAPRAKDDFGYFNDVSSQGQNLFRLAAYQKVYYDHYRNSLYESNRPIAYNFDWLARESNAQQELIKDCLVPEMLKYRYVNYRKDYFMALYPSLNFSSNMELGGTQAWHLPNSVVGLASNISGSTLSTSVLGTASNSGLSFATSKDRSRWSSLSGSSLPDHASVVTSVGNNLLVDQSFASLVHDHSVSLPNFGTEFSVQDIRAAFALDKLLRRSALAPKHIKEQYEARFGIKYKDDGHSSIRIGSFSSEINVMEVTQTSAGSDGQTPLGTIGGKGLGGQPYGKDIEYTCDYDSIIMGVSYFIPRPFYDSRNYDAFNIKAKREDFFQPEFQDLGLQPVYLKQLQSSFAQTEEQANLENNYLIGYQTRYQEYKTNVDRNYGLFEAYAPLSVFTNSFDGYKHLLASGGLSSVSNGILNTNFFKVLPTDADSIFVTPADATELTDQFYGFMRFKFVCNQNMSVFGIDNF